MKSNKPKVYLIIPLLVLITTLFSQEKPQEIIKKAMKDELERNMKNLALENLEKPFFISYTISDAKTLYISSTLGALIKSEEKPYRKHSARVLVGDYESDNENFVEMNNMYSFNMNEGYIPLENNYYGIRNSLWKKTDNMYKDAAELYERKISAINQQNLSEDETGLSDFSKVPKVKLDIPTDSFVLDKQKWEKTAKELSAIFKDYAEIFSSNVSIFLYQADIYFLNSEGTETKYPLSLAAVRVNAETQADDGESLFDHVLYYALTPDDLPAINNMKNEVKFMADNLVKIKNAPFFDENALFTHYFGVLSTSRSLPTPGGGACAAVRPFGGVLAPKTAIFRGLGVFWAVFSLKFSQNSLASHGFLLPFIVTKASYILAFSFPGTYFLRMYMKSLSIAAAI